MWITQGQVQRMYDDDEATFIMMYDVNEAAL